MFPGDSVLVKGFFAQQRVLRWPHSSHKTADRKHEFLVRMHFARQELSRRSLGR